MSERNYNDYAKANCIPTGYNEAVTQYIFGQSTVDMLLDKIDELEAELADMTKKYELASLPIGGLVDTARNLEQQLAEKERDFELLMLSKNEEINEWIAVRDDKNKVIDRQTDKIQELKKRVEIYDKALELACDNLYEINFKIYNTEMNFVDYFIEKAKEELENDTTRSEG